MAVDLPPLLSFFIVSLCRCRSCTFSISCCSAVRRGVAMKVIIEGAAPKSDPQCFMCGGRLPPPFPSHSLVVRVACELERDEGKVNKKHLPGCLPVEESRPRGSKFLPSSHQSLLLRVSTDEERLPSSSPD